MQLIKEFKKGEDNYRLELELIIRSIKSNCHLRIFIFRNGQYITDLYPDGEDVETFEEFREIYMERLKNTIPYEWVEEMKNELIAQLNSQVNYLI